MNRYSLTHVPDPTLLRGLRTLVAQDRATTALLIAHLAEVDDRRLYAAAGHPSLFAYCVHELGLSEDAAYKRIQATRSARRFPAIFPALADGRLHLSGVGLLAPYLTERNAAALLAAAAGKTKAEIELLLAERFPRPELLAWVQPLAPAVGLSGQLAPGQVGIADLQPAPGTVGATDRQLSPGTVGTTGAQLAPGRAGIADLQLAPGQVGATDRQLAPEPAGMTGAQLAPGRLGSADLQLAPGQVGAPARPRVAPLAPGRYGLQFTVALGTYEKLRYAQALLGHAVPPGELAEVFDRALDALIARLEQRKFAATSRPRHRRPQPNANPRHIPAEVRRAVWARDGGRCTFVSAAGHRCPSRTRLEYDHVEPVARGGKTTVAGMRLRCRAHNQYTAECAFGAGFMARKREAAGREAHEASARAAAATAEEAPARAAAARAAATEEARVRAAAEAQQARVRAAAVEEVVPWLRALGLRVDEARRAAAGGCEAAPDAPLEERVRHALRCSARPPQARAAY